jgi:dihydrofolate synthase/folylpolyglutamate synthase
MPAPPSTFSEAVAVLYRSFEAAGSPHGVSDQSSREPEWATRVLGQLKLLPIPYPVAVVAGSKGKGSTVRQTVAPLVEMGFRVGWIISPHLVDYEERIRINERCIDPETFIRLVGRVRPILERLQSEVAPGRYIGPHAGILAVALQWFREENVDFAVIEAGRGGRFDEVVCLKAPYAAIPTLLLEHRLELGPTLANVAWHKAGVLPQGGAAVVGPVGPTVRAVIAREARARSTRIDWYGKSVSVERHAEGITIRTPDATYPSVRLGLVGEYQESNAAIAVRLAELLLRSRGLKLDPTAVIDGLARVRSPGRLHEVFRDRVFLLDTAVHRSSLAPIETWIREQRSRGRRIALILSTPTDKDWRGVALRLSPLADHTIFCKPDNRPLLYGERQIGRLAERLSGAEPAVVLGAEVAIDRARALTKPDDAVALVGTQSFIAEALIALGEDAAAFLTPATRPRRALDRM